MIFCYDRSTWSFYHGTFLLLVTTGGNVGGCAAGEAGRSGGVRVSCTWSNNIVLTFVKTVFTTSVLLPRSPHHLPVARSSAANIRLTHIPSSKITSFHALVSDMSIINMYYSSTFSTQNACLLVPESFLELFQSYLHRSCYLCNLIIFRKRAIT